jgi:hypothetical protein
MKRCLFVCLFPHYTFLEHTERLLASSWVDGLLDGDNVKPDSLGKGAALSNGDNITISDGKGRGAVGSNILVTLLETPVLGNVVQVIPAHNNGTLHLCRDDNALKNTASDRNVSGEGALLVNEIAFNCSSRGANSKTNRLHKPHWLLAGASCCTNGTFPGNENTILALVCLLMLCFDPTFDSHINFMKVRYKPFE